MRVGEWPASWVHGQRHTAIKRGYKLASMARTLPSSLSSFFFFASNTHAQSNSLSPMISSSYTLSLFLFHPFLLFGAQQAEKELARVRVPAHTHTHTGLVADTTIAHYIWWSVFDVYSSTRTQSAKCIKMHKYKYIYLLSISMFTLFPSLLIGQCILSWRLLSYDRTGEKKCPFISWVCLTNTRFNLIHQVDHLHS